VGPVDEVARGQRSARRVGDPVVDQRLAQLLEREVSLVEPGCEPDRGAQLGVGVAVAARARLACAELARELRPELPAGVGGEVRSVGVLARALERAARPAVKARQALVARVEDVVRDEPGAQVGRCLADVVTVECLVGDRDLAAQHRAQCRSGRATLQPSKRGSRLVLLLESREQRPEPPERVRVTLCP
jgi:hypothetical protein